MLSQNVDVGTEGNVDQISVEVKVVGYDCATRLADVAEYADQEGKHASRGLAMRAMWISTCCLTSH
jgi:hypothetical protein